MKKLVFLLFGLLFNFNVSAGPVTGIEILDVIKEKDLVSLKLHSDRGPKGSWFIVIVDKTDPEFEQKMKLVQEKIDHKDEVKLVLEIISFSPHPSGSVYRSADVGFSKE